MERNQLALTIYKKVCVLVVFFLLSFSVSAQDYARVDSLVAHYPKTFKEPSLLAERIGQDFSDPYERTRAIFNWIALNISYSYDAPDVVSYIYPNKEEHKREQKRFQEKLSKLTLQKGIAVCEGYAHLFKELCDRLDVDCIVVSGDAKNGVEDIYRKWQSNHSWNIVTLEGKEYLIDPTWGAGHMLNGKYVKDIEYFYFFADPNLFIYKHYPKNYKHTLLKTKFSKEKYSKLPLLYTDGIKLYNLVSPLNGVLRMGKSDCSFVFKTDHPVSWVSYKVGNESYHDAHFEMIEGELHISLDLTGKKGRKLVLYINGDAVAVYKIRK